MKYSSVGYFIHEGFSNIFKNKKSTAISIITMICTMFLFGIFFAIGANVDSILTQVQTKQGMEVFLYDITDEQRDEFQNEIKSLDGVNTVSYKSKQQALDSFKEQMTDENGQAILEGYEGENNIFPASFVVTLSDLEKSEEIQTKIMQIGAKIVSDSKEDANINLEVEGSTENDNLVKRITSKDSTISTLITIARGVRITIGVIFAGLIIISITIISNTIRLAVHARRREISIMKYIGATNSFIRWPFLIEGIIIGIIAALITLLLVGGLYDTVIRNIETSNVLQKIGVNLLSFSELAKTNAIVFAALGVGVGILGSSISMKKYLEV